MIILIDSTVFLYAQVWKISFISGLMLGYVLHKMRDIKALPISPFIAIWIWGIVGAIGGSIVYGLFEHTVDFYRTGGTLGEDTLAARVAYNGLHRLGHNFIK